jgi:ribosomal protein L24E
MTFSFLSCVHVEILTSCMACGADLFPRNPVYIVEVDGDTVRCCRHCYEEMRKQMRAEEEAAEEAARLAAEECEA